MNTPNTQLIPVFPGELSGAPAQLVDARLLHSFLESSQQFGNWINNRISDYGFIESQDYLIILLNRSGGTAGKKRIDYHLTLDMAKELSMVERNDKGKQARRYFIECERRLQQPPLSSPTATLNLTLSSANPQHQRWLVKAIGEMVTIVPIAADERLVRPGEIEADPEQFFPGKALVDRRVFQSLVGALEQLSPGAQKTLRGVDAAPVKPSPVKPVSKKLAAPAGTIEQWWRYVLQRGGFGVNPNWPLDEGKPEIYAHYRCWCKSRSVRHPEAYTQFGRLAKSFGLASRQLVKYHNKRCFVFPSLAECRQRFLALYGGAERD